MSKSKKVFLFNPTDTDFAFQYDVKGDRNPKGFVIHALEDASFSPALAKHAEKHLIIHVVNVRDLNPLIEQHRLDIKEEIHMKV